MDGSHLIQDDSIPDEYLKNNSSLIEAAIGPGRVWLVECDPAGLSPAHANLLLQANVVLYERALGAALAAILPTGLYAEPLPAPAMTGPAIAPRARHFAAEGWSVVQLVERRDGRGRLVQVAAREPGRPGGASPGLIFTANGLAG